MHSLDKNRVVIAMSGGVDSSVAAALLQKTGKEVIGITLKLWDAPETGPARQGSCCSVEDISDARRVADQLGIPYYVINSKERFREQVVDPFVAEYLRGRTPNPCALCNDKVKFSFLLEKAFELGAYYVATGHYVRKQWDESQALWSLWAGRDVGKDQSYFLFSLGQNQLEHSLFPVGDLSKDEVRAIAADLGLKTSHKPESQEICFVPRGHGEFIEKYAPEKLPGPGRFMHEDGRELGGHEGIHRYTVGQRRGTGVAEGERVYVKSIDPVSGVVQMGSDASLYSRSLWARGVRWVGEPLNNVLVTARIRYRHSGAQAMLYQESSGQIRLDFIEAQRAIAPGQAVVFYHGDQVLGGAWIERNA